MDVAAATVDPTLLTAIVAVVVPSLAFRYSLRQDKARWLREQRAECYVDLLTEAYAEKEYFGWEVSDDAEREVSRETYVDLRLPRLERARLGSRGAIFGSKRVLGIFKRLQLEALTASLSEPRDHAERSTAKAQVAETFSELESAIRREIGAEDIWVDAEGSSEHAASRCTDARPPRRDSGAARWGAGLWARFRRLRPLAWLRRSRPAS